MTKIQKIRAALDKPKPEKRRMKSILITPEMQSASQPYRPGRPRKQPQDPREAMNYTGPWGKELDELRKKDMN